MLSRRTLTKQEESSITNAVLILSHWIRTILDDSTVSYKWERNLMEIVIKYYFTAIFEWDPLRSSPHLELSPNGRSFRYKAGPNTDPGKSLCSKNILCSADSISRVRWELTVKQQGEQFYMLMGFVGTEGLFNPNENCFIGTDENQWALWVVDGSFPMTLFVKVVAQESSVTWCKSGGKRWHVECTFNQCVPERNKSRAPARLQSSK